LGALESGVAAKYLGTTEAVLVGGIVTLMVVAAAAILAPKLRKLRLDPAKAAERDITVDASLDADVTGKPVSAI
jgi:hypothetical protein